MVDPLPIYFVIWIADLEGIDCDHAQLQFTTTCEPTANRSRVLIHFNRQRIVEVKSAVTDNKSCRS
jgi:hypothetical protein